MKLKASIYRIIVSFFLIITILLPLYLLWYPYPLNLSLNINKLIFIILSVNFFISLIFTYLFYNPNRKDNKINMIIVSVIQVLAFFVGFYFFTMIRPAWLVQHQEKIYIVQPSSVIYPENLNIIEKLIRESWSGPVLRTVKFSKILSEQQIQLVQSTSGEGIEYQPLNYKKFDNRFALEYAKPVPLLHKFNTSKELNDILKDVSSKNYMWLPLRSTVNGNDMVVLINNKGELIKIVALKPW